MNKAEKARVARLVDFVDAISQLGQGIDIINAMPEEKIAESAMEMWMMAADLAFKAANQLTKEFEDWKKS